MSTMRFLTKYVSSGDEWPLDEIQWEHAKELTPDEAMKEGFFGDHFIQGVGNTYHNGAWYHIVWTRGCIYAVSYRGKWKSNSEFVNEVKFWSLGHVHRWEYELIGNCHHRLTCADCKATYTYDSGD